MKEVLMGAIVGDYMGSFYEFLRCKDYWFTVNPKQNDITDDSILTIAIADAAITGLPYSLALRYWGNKYPAPMGGYGNTFSQWLATDGSEPYNSLGNGAAMRISAIGWLFDSMEQTMEEAYKATEVTHSHPEGINGGCAVAAAIYLLRTGGSKAQLKKIMEEHFSYDIGFTLDELRPTYGFNESCMESVPVAVQCYLESKDWEDAVRLAVSMGGDADTLAAIAGSIAIADKDYDIPPYLLAQAKWKLDAQQIAVIDAFHKEVQQRLGL